MSLFHIDRSLDVITASAYTPVPGPTLQVPGNSDYPELVFGGLVGPTALLTYRRLVRLVSEATEPVDVEVSELGATLGVNRKVILRSLERLVRFRFAHLESAEFLVHTCIPVAGTCHLQRSTATVRADHYRLLQQLGVTSNTTQQHR